MLNINNEGLSVNNSLLLHVLLIKRFNLPPISNKSNNACLRQKPGHHYFRMPRKSKNFLDML